MQCVYDALQFEQRHRSHSRSCQLQVRTRRNMEGEKHGRDRRWDRKSNSELKVKERVRRRELQQREEDCEPYYRHVKFASMCMCVHKKHLVCWHTDLWCSAVSRHVFVCVSSRTLVPEGPRFRSVSVGTNRLPTGTQVKEMFAMDTHHRRKYLYQWVCFYGEEK